MTKASELFAVGTCIGRYVIGKPLIEQLTGDDNSAVYEASSIAGGGKKVFKCILTSEQQAHDEMDANEVLSGGPYLAVGTDFERVTDRRGGEHWGCFMPYYTGGDLLEYMLNSPSRLTEDKVREMAYRVLCAIRHVHGLGWVHRDVKLENIFLSCTGDCPETFLGDFGLASYLPDGESFTSVVGSRPYFAPELLQPPWTYGAPVDMWAFGVTVYAMLNCAMPFPNHEEDPLGFYSAVINGDWDRKPMLECSDEVIDLIDKLLKVNPDERLTADQALEHWFFAAHGGLDAIKGELSELTRGFVVGDEFDF